MLRDVQNQYGSNLPTPFFLDFEKPHGFLAYALLNLQEFTVIWGSTYRALYRYYSWTNSYSLELILVPKNSKFSDHLSWNYYKIKIVPSLLQVKTYKGLWPMKFGWLDTRIYLLYNCSPYEIEHQNLTVITTFWKIIYNSIILRQNVRGELKKKTIGPI